MELDKRAEEIASQWHRHQTYGSDRPYIVHPRKVVRILSDYGFDSDVMRAAGWLHDVLEDCLPELTLPQRASLLVRSLMPEEGDHDDVLNVFRTAHLVLAVTNRPGGNRKARHALTYPCTRAAGVDAVALKLADRLANVKDASSREPKLLKMYQKEHVVFFDSLFFPHADLLPMWKKVNHLLGMTHSTPVERPE